MPQRGDENGADTQAAATGEIDTRIALGIVAEHDLSGAYALGGDADIGLQTNAKIGSAASGAGPANDFVPRT